MSLKMVSPFLVVASLLWALSPAWGGAFFVAAWAFIAWRTSNRVTRARAAIDASREELAAVLTPDALEWVRRFPLFYVWRATARQWALAWRMGGVLALLLLPWFTLRAVFMKETWELAFLPPLGALVLLGLWVGHRLEVVELFKKRAFEASLPLHEEAVRSLSLRAAVGKWPPVPSPDGLVDPPPPPALSPPVSGPRAGRPAPATVRPPGDGPAE